MPSSVCVEACPSLLVHHHLLQGYLKVSHGLSLRKLLLLLRAELLLLLIGK
jgi:hypothetical protein